MVSMRESCRLLQMKCDRCDSMGLLATLWCTLHATCAISRRQGQTKSQPRRRWSFLTPDLVDQRRCHLVFTWKSPDICNALARCSKRAVSIGSNFHFSMPTSSKEDSQEQPLVQHYSHYSITTDSACHRGFLQSLHSKSIHI